MNHRSGQKKLGRTSAHRKSLFRNMATSLIVHETIETTLPKAKALRPVVEKLITMAKEDTLANRRLAMTSLYAINRTDKGNAKKWTAVHKLFTDIAPRFDTRPGGYTRVLRTRIRPGDKAQMAIIQFVAEEAKTEPKKKARKVIKSEVAEVRDSSVEHVS